MNVLKVIIVVGFGMILLACGGESKRSAEGAEEGMPKTEDGRIVLSSELPDKGLVIPEGEAEDKVISSQKLTSIIVNRFDSISEVFDISLVSDWYPFSFTVLFNIRTTKGSIYRDIECRGSVKKGHLMEIRNCESDQVTLARGAIWVSLWELNIEDSTTRARFKKSRILLLRTAV